ncbi:helix-turn-helix transcriptional regulator [Paenibacillus sp. MWE-103]|uniref:Helix-turn-helix transcriptional regulator n=1 Tax=Paenibacillus artemisiicola TaxID=1172618 RepID=A0ABS3WL14_9BACL|nr:AraC family transcriptional regulator [Paenibacillus artemisiicola]MBO7748972.1 helix-turn-helix transcriptional regulator [Paenibacillus artemisiicola]
MAITRPIRQMLGKDLFDPALPIFVNRAVETFQLTEHRHDFLEISYVGEGAGTHHVGAETFPVAHGDIFFLPVGISHVFRPSTAAPKHPLVVYNCVIAPEAARRLAEAVPGGEALLPLLASGGCRRFRDPYGEFYRLIQRLHYEYLTDQPGREASLHQGVLALLLCLFRLDARQGGESGTAVASTRFETVLETIHGRFDQELTARELAAIAGIGERQFHRLFAKQAGMPLKAYHQNVRIREACRLLRTTDRKISDIAAAVGYQDIAYFNALFKRKNGMSPRAYRKGEPG